MLFYVKRTVAYASVSKITQPAPSPIAGKNSTGSKVPAGGKAGVGMKTLDMGGKKTHPIKVSLCFHPLASAMKHLLT